MPGHPEVCQLAEAMLSEIVGLPVREQCEKGERPRCCFEIPLRRDPSAAREGASGHAPGADRSL